MSLTVEELDEALAHAQAVPADERTAGWHAFVDGLLEQRTALQRAEQRITEIKAERAKTEAQARTTRIMSNGETR